MKGEACDHLILDPRSPQCEAFSSTQHMATSLLHFPTTTTTSRLVLKPGIRHRQVKLARFPSLRLRVAAYKVTIEHEGERRTLEVAEDETILERALEEGLEVSHDCKLGVCMTCPARLVSGAVDQSEGMLSDDVVERGYALLCASYPRSDCHIRTIPEEELLALQLATAND
ncbi:ferredoxin C 1, chloroplastic-like [Musa acuminata AAA Group]|uniref:ferredoxin C 1, chloroplastic-like n=1 Tax=Musa acuminata AAA Group TaxID=214697 RepID=UPI0031D818FE